MKLRWPGRASSRPTRSPDGAMSLVEHLAELRRRLIIAVAALMIGAALALVTFPKALDFFRAFGGGSLELLYTPGKYLGLLMLMMVIFGLGFEFPIVLVFLEVAGILNWRQLASWRRYAIVTIFVVD